MTNYVPWQWQGAKIRDSAAQSFRLDGLSLFNLHIRSCFAAMDCNFIHFMYRNAIYK